MKNFNKTQTTLSMYAGIAPVVFRVSEPNPPPNGAQPGTRTLTEEEYNNLLNTVRSEERTKQHQTIQAKDTELNTLRTQLNDVQSSLNQLKEQRRQQELAGMTPDARIETQIRELTQQVKDLTTARETDAQTFQTTIRAAELVAYRERAIRAFNGKIIEAMVQGRSEEEIDAACDRAHEAYNTQRAEIEAQVRAELQASQSPQNQPQVIPQQPQPGVPQTYVPPPNPYYVPNAPMPVASNPVPVSMGPSPIDLSSLTSEQAVRSGRYGTVRNAIQAQIAGVPYYGPLGTQPRYGQPQQSYQVMPGGVNVPVASPMSPPINPHIPQQPPQAPQQVPQQQGPDIATLAAEALQRTLNGGNPVISHPDNQGAPGVANQLNQYIQNNPGVTPQTAFANRFAPPPITQGN